MACALVSAEVLFIPARLPIMVEGTEDGVDVWIAGVNQQVFTSGGPH